MQSAVDSIVHSLPAYRENTGLVVGVVQHGRCSTFGYGRTQDTGLDPPRGDTVFEIGSISKVFTTSLLSITLANGQLHLEEAVRDLVPHLSGWPSELSLFCLATHTSGLPKMPSNIFRSMLRDWNNPYAAYSTADLLGYLSRHKPRGRLPAPVNYSNLGMALLGFIVAQRLGDSYEQVVVKHVCDPLSLSDTRITLTSDQRGRLAPPHSPAGKPGHNWDLSAFAGAGALRSTANDLLKFLAAHLGEAPAILKTALGASHPIRTETFLPPGGLQRLLSGALRKGPDLRYRRGMALGWTVGHLHSGGKQVHWHHGATGGYRAFAGYVKDTDTGVVVLANSGLGFVDAILNTTATDDIGFKVLEHLNASD